MQVRWHFLTFGFLYTRNVAILKPTGLSRKPWDYAVVCVFMCTQALAQGEQRLNNTTSQKLHFSEFVKPLQLLTFIEGMHSQSRSLEQLNGFDWTRLL